MQLANRHYVSGSRYRFGFQGQEGDDEWSGEGSMLAFKYRIHDPRLGRFLSIDPLAPKYTWNSPYAFSENKTIAFVELEGLETEQATSGTKVESESSCSEIPSITINGRSRDKDGLRIHWILEDATPKIYHHTQNVLNQHPNWRVLRYNGPNSPITKANRKVATGKCPQIFGTWKDEFPYASTWEGGKNAYCQNVPILEQRLQAWQLSNVYRGMNAGDRFRVVLVPKINNKPPLSDPYKFPWVLDIRPEMKEEAQDEIQDTPYEWPNPFQNLPQPEIDPGPSIAAIVGTILIIIYAPKFAL